MPQELLNRIRDLVRSGQPRHDRASNLASAIKAFGQYSWVGIYDVDSQSVSILAFAGSGPPAFPTFPITKGLTGSAIAQKSPVGGGDVANDPRYLTTFGTTASEIIIPILDRQTGQVIGTINVESSQKNAFSQNDQQLLQQCASAALPLWLPI
ncbi:MAG TPA: GAF domain-containing protein [Tepidisphaeraceae bacterium]|jgi:putative methionine-R-sulfoxide reductase with GAF domain|nr:GAF domain-containing protein [Tepidisphaeraceae bacterium]